MSLPLPGPSSAHANSCGASTCPETITVQNLGNKPTFDQKRLPGTIVNYDMCAAEARGRGRGRGRRRDEPVADVLTATDSCGAEIDVTMVGRCRLTLSN